MCLCCYALKIMWAWVLFWGHNNTNTLNKGVLAYRAKSFMKTMAKAGTYWNVEWLGEKFRIIKCVLRIVGDIEVNNLMKCRYKLRCDSFLFWTMSITLVFRIQGHTILFWARRGGGGAVKLANNKFSTVGPSKYNCVSHCTDLSPVSSRLPSKSSTWCRTLYRESWLNRVRLWLLVGLCPVRIQTGHRLSQVRFLVIHSGLGCVSVHSFLLLC